MKIFKFILPAFILISLSAYFSVASFALNENSTFEAPPISLNLKNAPIESVLSALGSEAGLNIVAGSDVRGKITISLNNVSPIAALNSIAKTAGLTYRIENNIIKIESLISKESRNNISFENGLITKTFTLNFILPDDVKDTISKLDLKDTKFLPTKGSRTILVEGPFKTLQKIAKIIKSLDTTPKEVLVESRIMEIRHGNSTTPSTFGVKAKYTGNTFVSQTEGFANPASSGAAGFYTHVLKGNIDSYLQALEHKEKFNLLANPKIIALSGKTANIISGSKLGYKTTLTTTTGTVQNVDFLEVGTKLSFTPTISDDGAIQMDIHPEVSEGSITADGLPQKQTTEATTTVLVRDGETIIIGGLIKNKSTEVTSGIPIIMNIPVLGNFFKRKELLWEKTEIIAALTPHLITSASSKQMADEAGRIEKDQKNSKIGEPPTIEWWVK